MPHSIKLLLKLCVVLPLIGFALFLLYELILDQRCLTWHDYMKVKDGMTQEEVGAALGAPRSSGTKPDGGKEVHWIGRNKGMIYVEFSSTGTMLRKHYMEEARNYRLSFFPRDRE